MVLAKKFVWPVASTIGGKRYRLLRGNQQTLYGLAYKVFARGIYTIRQISIESSWTTGLYGRVF
jgi:hypothetical protein